MGRLKLRGLFQSKQQKRLKAETFDPTTAPHRGLVTDLIRAHLPPLQVRLRRDLIDELALRVLEFEPSPMPLQDYAQPEQLLLLVLRAQQAAQQIGADSDFLTRRFDNLSSLLREIEGEHEQRVLMAEYLVQTVPSTHKLRQDLKALKRHLGYDALRERDEYERERLALCTELSMLFIARAIDAAVLHPDESLRIAANRFRDRAETDQFLAEVAVTNGRWQTRLAAADGLVRLCRHLAELGMAPADPAALWERMSACVASRDEHPWVRAKALEVAYSIAPERGERLVLECLQNRPEGQGPRDFLLRRLALELAVDVLPTGRAAAVLDALISGPEARQRVRLHPVDISWRESSEHVRLGFAPALRALPPEHALVRLRWLAGLDGHDEPSPKVRAQAVLAARQIAASKNTSLAVREAAGMLMVEVLAGESEVLPLRCSCEELAALAADLIGIGDEEHLQTLAPVWVRSLLALSRSSQCPEPIVEIAADAAESITRELSHERRRATQLLRDLVREIPPGQARTMALARLPRVIVEQCHNPHAIGRILADLTRDDWGLGLRVSRRAITLWRGDQLRMRLWRILYELRHPAPNKRQGFVHTSGRYHRSNIRAHPAKLDEATATTVPGERVHVDGTGSWGRHVPTVDDLLDLPVWRSRPIHICSSYGVTTLNPSRWLLKRLYTRLALTWRYPAVVGLRQAAIASTEANKRQHYLSQIRDRFGIDIEFHGYDFAPIAARADLAPNPAIAALFPQGDRAPQTPAPAAAVVPFLQPIEDFAEWLDSNMSYFSSATQNSQAALALFIGGMAILYVSTAYAKRRHLERSRTRIPLSIGGWGTRGKSGTERLKAGLFHGFGFDVFVKTTGCEAMLLHAAPAQKPVEIFVYRPYDKATIWEQYNLVTLASRLKPNIFLWECMALNPRYVKLLQHDWMHDDMITLTNAYPDHEDIQGPAGINVAEVISQFIARNSTLITSEVNFLPLFAEVCRERNTRLIPVPEREGDLIADDVLALFPYNEHPRNIALVAKMAAQFGLDPTLSIVTMAENVIADLGVLKAYATVRVQGRTLTFINGMSANERTGFLNSWQRMGLDQLDCDAAPEELLVTVINNRADRISRSEVFARMMVNDINVDRHVIIGTNIKGLRHFINRALDTYLAEVRVLDDDAISTEAAIWAHKRLQTQMARLRIPKPSAQAAVRRLEIYASAIEHRIDPMQLSAVEKAMAELLAPRREASVALRDVLRELQADRTLSELLDRVLTPATPTRPTDDDVAKQLATVETVDAPTRTEVIEHFVHQLARIIVRSRLETRLEQVLAESAKSARDGFHTTLHDSYRELYLDMLVILENPETSGDQIILRCATAVPPGTRVRIMGAQNIKGTGLDFVYRWIAIQSVVNNLVAMHSERGDRRVAALRELEAFEDHGVVDVGLARSVLAIQPVRQPNAEEMHLRERIRAKLDQLYTQRMTQLRSQATRDTLDRVAGLFEGMVDYLDSIRRYRQSRQIMDDLAERRISHGRAALEMRNLVARQKGGWLAKSLRKWRQGAKSGK